MRGPKVTESQKIKTEETKAGRRIRLKTEKIDVRCKLAVAEDKTGWHRGEAVKGGLNVC